MHTITIDILILLITNFNLISTTNCQQGADLGLRYLASVYWAFTTMATVGTLPLLPLQQLLFQPLLSKCYFSSVTIQLCINLLLLVVMILNQGHVCADVCY